MTYEEEFENLEEEEFEKNSDKGEENKGIIKKFYSIIKKIAVVFITIGLFLLGIAVYDAIYDKFYKKDLLINKYFEIKKDLYNLEMNKNEIEKKIEKKENKIRNLCKGKFKEYNIDIKECKKYIKNENKKNDEMSNKKNIKQKDKNQPKQIDI